MISLKKISGVMILSLRSVWRTKTVVALIVLLGASVLLLPRVIHGDGTPEGAIRILLMYTIGFAFAILCLATLWTASALFSSEIDSHRIHLSIVKPIHPIELWLGKWFALLILDGFFLALVYAGAYTQLHWQIAQNNWQSDIRLESRQVTHPLLKSPREEALETYMSLSMKKALPTDMSKSAVLRVLEEKATEKYDLINPGEEVRWMFRLQHPLLAHQLLTVRLRFDTEFSTRTAIKGICRLRSPQSSSPPLEIPLTDFSQQEIEFDVDARAFGTVARLDTFELSFRHTGHVKHTAALMTRFRQDVTLLTPGGTFVMNLLCSAFIHWTILALLAALGLMLSACFSLPVAAFLATVVLILVLVGNSVVKVVSAEDEKHWQNRIGIWVSRGVCEWTRHTMPENPLAALTFGERITVHALQEALLWNVLLLPLLCAGIGCLALTQRELAAGDR